MKVMQNLTQTPSQQKGMTSYMQTVHFSSSKAVIKGAPPPSVLNAYRLFFCYDCYSYIHID